MRFNRSHIVCECRWWRWVWTQSPCSRPLPHAVTKVSSPLAVLKTNASLFCIVFLLHREMLEDLKGQWFRGLWVLVTQHRVWGSWWGPNMYGKERSLKDGYQCDNPCSYPGHVQSPLCHPVLTGFLQGRYCYYPTLQRRNQKLREGKSSAPQLAPEPASVTFTRFIFV